MRLSISLFFLLFTACLFSQTVTYLYPIKVDHKWGFADKRGRIVIQPKYDAIGDQYLHWHGRSTTESPYRLVETGGLLGLIDDQCQEVLPTKFRHISPLNRSLFIVAEDTLFRMVNLIGETALEGDFEEVMLLDTMKGWFLKMKKNGLWGVHELGVGEILPAIYKDIEIQYAGNVFFKIKKPGKADFWGLVNKNNRSILPNTFFDVKAINENFFTTLEADNKWVVRDSTGKQVLLTKWNSCKPLNRHLISLTQDWDRQKLFSCARKDTLSLPAPYDEFKPCNDQYIIYREGGFNGLLDTAGNIALAATYEDIQPAWDSLFRVRLRGSGWGMLSLSRGLLLPCKYTNIGEFQGDFAIVETAGLVGLIDTVLQELIPPAFDRIVLGDTLIKAYENGNLTLFKITNDGQVALMDEFSNVRTLRVGYGSKFYMEAKPLKNGLAQVMGAFEFDPSPFTSQTDGRWTWKRDPDSKKWGLNDKQIGPTGNIPPSFMEVLYLKKPALSFVFTDEKTTENTTDVLPAFYTIPTFLRAALFSHDAGKFITPFDMLGLRGKDFEDGLPLAVFLDKNGQFGMMDKFGKSVMAANGKPMRFTWIGTFHKGKARFCQGGRIVLADEGKQAKTEVDVVDNFLVQFGMHTNVRYGTIKDRSILIEEKKGEQMRWGYLDTMGQIIIEPRFDFAGEFEDTFAVNQLNGLWGVIDLEGKEKLPFQYNSVSAFHGNWLVGVKSPARLVFNPNGYERITKLYARQGNFTENRCRVQMDSLWGFIDEEGNEIVPCHFEEARDFSEGLAAVRKDGRWGFIDKEGNIPFDLKIPEGDISQVGNFGNGLAWFKVGYHYGYINPQGQVSIPLDFTKVFDFKFGVARAVFKGKTGLIDTLGHWILKPERFEYVADFNQWGVAEAREKFNGKRCLLNAKGEILTPLKYADIGEFHEGFAKISSGKYFGLLHKTGKEILPMEYEAIGEVSEGLLNVRPKHSTAWHFVDTLGQPAFKGEFEMIEPFQHGHAFVQVNHFDPTSRFVIDRKGKRLFMNPYDSFEFYENGIFGIYTPKGIREGFRRLNYYFADTKGRPMFGRLFEKIKPYKGETALVQVSNRWGMLNRNGLFVMPPKYPFVNMQENGEAVVNLFVQLGLVNSQGEEIFPPAYDQIEWMSGNLFRLEFGEKVGYAKKDGEWVWEMGK